MDEQLKQQIFQMLKDHKTFREISRECSVSNQTIQNIRDEMSDQVIAEKKFQTVNTYKFACGVKLQAFRKRLARLKFSGAKGLLADLDEILEDFEHV